MEDQGVVGIISISAGRDSSCEEKEVVSWSDREFICACERERNEGRVYFDGNDLSVCIQGNVHLMSEYKCSERHVYLWSCRFPCLLTFFYLLGSSHL